MGNLKSKKLKISEAPSDEKQNEERINTIKTDISDATGKSINSDGNKEKDDNASSASTVEALDDK